MSNFNGIVYLSEEQKDELFSNGSIVVNGEKIVYDDNTQYETPDIISDKVEELEAKVLHFESEIEVISSNKIDKTTTINGKALSSDITLTASDVGALPNTTEIPTTYVSYRNEQKLNEYEKEIARQNIGALSSDITIPEGVKLYNDAGQNTDGAITQKGTTDALTNLNTILEEKINENKTNIGSIGNELGDLNSSIDGVAGNLSDLQVTVNGNIQNISVLQNDLTNVNTSISNLNSSVSTLGTNKAEKDLSNVTYPQLIPDGLEHTSSGYTTYMTTDSMTWYIKHPTGKVECGHIVSMSGTERVVELPVTFKTTEYSLSLQQVSWGGGTRYYIVTDKDVSKFKITASSSTTAYISIYCVSY